MLTVSETVNVVKEFFENAVEAHSFTFEEFCNAYGLEGKIAEKSYKTCQDTLKILERSMPYEKIKEIFALTQSIDCGVRFTELSRKVQNRVIIEYRVLYIEDEHGAGHSMVHDPIESQIEAVRAILNDSLTLYTAKGKVIID
jgi:hypothetical protein